MEQNKENNDFLFHIDEVEFYSIIEDLEVATRELDGIANLSKQQVSEHLYKVKELEVALYNLKQMLKEYGKS